LPEANTERQQAVLSILHDLAGIEPLKQLFWSELNYDRVNRTLSRQGWGEQAAKALAEDPLLFATGAKDFQVIHARLVNHFKVWSENTRTGELRVTVADCVWCGAQTGSRCSAKVRRLQRFE